MLNWFPGLATVKYMKIRYGKGQSLRTDDASNMSTMAIAIIVRVLVRNRSVGTIVSVANKVISIGDHATRTKASTKARMVIVGARVDDSNTDIFASDT